MKSKPTRFGEMLRLYRTVQNVSVRAVAADIGISHATLSRIERGEMCDVATLFKIAVWLSKAAQ